MAILLDAISGHDPADPHSAAEPVTPIDWFAKLPEIQRPPTFARLGGFFTAMATPVMQSALDSTLAHFCARGASIVEAPWPPTFAHVHRNHRRIFEYELASSHKTRIRQHRDDYLPGLASLIEEGLTISEAEYLEAKRHQAATSREVACIFGDADVAVCPAALGPAPDPSTTGDPAFNSPWSYTGLPTVSLPIALAPDGLPLGIQLVGRRNDERSLFEAALWCEATLRAPDSRHA